MRGRVAIDAMITIGVRTDDSNQCDRREGRGEGFDGGWWWSKANLDGLSHSRSFLFKRIDSLATLTTVGVFRCEEGWDSMPWGMPFGASIPFYG